MKFKFVIFLASILLGINIAQGQKTIQRANQVWLAYANQTRFSKHWGSWTDLHLRTKDDFFNDLSQAFIRIGLTYYLNDDLKLTGGYAYINHFPGDNHSNISQPEHRPWQQIQWNTKHERLRLMQWFRLEERFRRKIQDNDNLADGYNFNWRLRYNIQAQFPLSRKRFQPNTFSFVLNDEVHVNFGKEIVYNYFDQNRFFVGFNYHISKTGNLQFGYMNYFQQLAAGNRYKSNQVARVFYFHNIDLRKN